MKSLFASIFTTLHPALVRRAASWLLPWKWSKLRTGTAGEQLETKFRETLEIPGGYDFFSFYNARSALYRGMSLLDIGPGDEIILQAYTCVSVPNALIARGARPIYVDIDPTTLNIDPGLIEQAITPNTKAILVQHTFGCVAELDRVMDICQRHNLKLIEDCAHALGASYQGQSVGTYGDMAIYSFGRDKVITSCNGGVLLMKQKYVKSKTGNELREQLKKLGLCETIKNLLYVIIGRWSYKLYDIKIGKLLYRLAAKMKLLPLIITDKEKHCAFSDFHYILPNCLADLACFELGRLEDVNNDRKQGAILYKEKLGDTVIVPAGDGNIYLRVVAQLDDPKAFIAESKKRSLHLGDPRYDKVIAGRGVELEEARYTLGSCPQAELLASRTVNLPNHSLMTDSAYQRTVALFI